MLLLILIAVLHILYMRVWDRGWLPRHLKYEAVLRIYGYGCGAVVIAMLLKMLANCDLRWIDRSNYENIVSSVLFTTVAFALAGECIWRAVAPSYSTYSGGDYWQKRERVALRLTKFCWVFSLVVSSRLLLVGIKLDAYHGLEGLAWVILVYAVTLIFRWEAKLERRASENARTYPVYAYKGGNGLEGNASNNRWWRQSQAPGMAAKPSGVCPITGHMLLQSSVKVIVTGDNQIKVSGVQGEWSTKGIWPSHND